MEENKKSFVQRLSGSIQIKLLIIALLTIVLLIPMNWINSLIYERHEREMEVSNEIAEKWGNNQVISGPILMIPYQEKIIILNNPESKSSAKTEWVKKWIYLLPQSLHIQASINPEYLKRGIYQTVVYSSKQQITGDFAQVDIQKLKIEDANIFWDEARLIFGITDLKGLTNSPTLVWKDSTYSFENDYEGLNIFKNNLSISIPIQAKQDTKESFKLNLDLRGAKSLNYLPLGKQTNIHVSGKWNNPSFNGAFLPEDRQVSSSAFQADWKIPSLAINYPQQWAADIQPIYPHDSSLEDGQLNNIVQVNFLSNVDNYQKNIRVAKYGMLIIMLTFTALLLTEIIKKRKIHMIQYALIAAAMILFYSLLLAISEHLGFNWAYLIAAVATITLISSFIHAIIKNRKTSLLFAGILGIFYVFIFILLLMQDFSLIVGTIGLFIILAFIMKFSTKINFSDYDTHLGDQ